MRHMDAETVELPFCFYNLDNGRDHGQVRREVHAILDTGPAFFGAAEAVTYRFGNVRGHVQIRDTSSRSRANLVAWIREDLVGDHPAEDWYDLTTSWPRTQYAGIHEPRSFLRTRVGRIPVFLAHQPPKGLGRLTEDGQQEGVDVLAREMAPWARDGFHRRPVAERQYAHDRPRVLLWDANRTAAEPGPGPAMLAKRIGGEPVGRTRIDGAVIRGDAKASRPRYPRRVGGVRLRSDHGHAFRCTLTVPAHWATPTKEHHR